VQEGDHSTAEALYLPYGTRTLKFEVVNNTGRPMKLWLRPESTPPGFPEHVIHGYGDDDPEIWVHWGGGEESGANVKMKDILYKSVPTEVANDGEPHPVFLNLTHSSGAGNIRSRTLTVRAYTGEEAAEQPLDSTLKVSLVAPNRDGTEAEGPARGVWNEDKTRLHFAGDLIPDYVSRWWAPSTFGYRPAGDLPGRLSVGCEDNTLTVKLQCEEADRGGTCLAEIVDNDWRPGQDTQSLRHVFAELFHFLESRYFVARLWFLWLDKRIGPTREVPDAERVDVLFDAETVKTLFLGTDFHYREVWTQLRDEAASAAASPATSPAACPRVTLNLRPNNFDDFLRLMLIYLVGRKSEGNPTQQVCRHLQDRRAAPVGARQKGPNTGAPFFDAKGFNFPYTIMSKDVRKA
jgi:hypothetical protein